MDETGKERPGHAQTALFRALANRNGMTLISGCTGSGKSTALAHTMEALIQERPGDNFISVEDPPEKPIPGMHQIRVNSKLDQQRTGGLSAYTLAIASTNRDDPDTVMIGEIRYADAAMAAIEVAQSGHAVWATIHASDAFGILTRLEVMLRGHMHEPLRTLCDPTVLSGMEYQRLVAKLCPHCRRPVRENREALPRDVGARLERCLPPELLSMATHGMTGCFCAIPKAASIVVQAVCPDFCGRRSWLKSWSSIQPCSRSCGTAILKARASYWRDELHGMTVLRACAASAWVRHPRPR